jgi:hypothetical protein
VVALVLLCLVYWFGVRLRQPAPDWSWHLAADPLPADAATVAQRNRWVAVHGRLMSAGTLQKVVLVGLLWMIYSLVLPVSLWVARSARGVEPVLTAFGFRVLMNAGLVVLAGWLLARTGGSFDEGNALFFVLLLSLITMLDDRYRPIYRMRFAAPGRSARL